METIEIKKFLLDNGADVFGIGSIERFKDAPEGFHPANLYPQVQSVISFAKRTPRSSMGIDSTIPYTVIEKLLVEETHRIAYKLMLFFEDHGYGAVIVPSEPYEYWDNDTKTGKGLVSLKHIAVCCGLGTMGKNHLLYHPQYGSLLKLGAVVTNAVLEPDRMFEKSICLENCNLCIDECPVGAIDKNGVNQKKCRSHSAKLNLKGEMIYTCNNCRSICPNKMGAKHQIEN
jgi:epoxyqueuosine reductase